MAVLKTIPFRTEVPYLGFWWDLQSHEVHLPGKKKAKYLAAITKWGTRHTYNLLEVQKLYGKLQHTALVIPAGHAHLTSMETMPTCFNNSPFILHSPPLNTLDDLVWWQHQLSHANIFSPILKPQPLIKHKPTWTQALVLVW